MSKNNIRTVESDNIVGRLYNVINELKYFSGENSNGAFSKVFSLDKSDKAGIMYNYAELFKMCNLGISEIEKLNPKNAIKHKNALNNAIEGLSKIYFNISPGSYENGMDKFKQHFNSELILSLEYCADFLSEYSDEQDIEEEKIQEMIKEIEALIEEVFGCKLDSDLEKILICQLNNVRESLFKYKLYGSEGIVNSISTTVGTLILNRELVDNEKSMFTVEKIFGILSKINTIVSFKNNSLAILGTIYKQITGNN